MISVYVYKYTPMHIYLRIAIIFIYSML